MLEDKHVVNSNPDRQIEIAAIAEQLDGILSGLDGLGLSLPAIHVQTALDHLREL